jgi:hypothetical protein
LTKRDFNSAGKKFQNISENECPEGCSDSTQKRCEGWLADEYPVKNLRNVA